MIHTGAPDPVEPDSGPGSDADRPEGPEAPPRRLERIRARLRILSEVPEALRELEARQQAVRADAVEVTGDLEARTMEWLRERQDAETHLTAYRDRARELRDRLQALEGRGPDAPCPTCGRHLEDHFGPVLDTLREEWDTVVQDGTWWRRRREQLELKPEAVRELEARSLRLHAELESVNERVERTRWALRELEELREEEAALGPPDPTTS